MSFEFLSPDRLTDGVIDLVVDSREPANPEKGHVPMYRYRITRHGDPEKIGELRLRVGQSEELELAGHIGYQIDEPHRGHGYAARACELVRSVALAHGLDRLRITCEVNNVASRRTLEKLDAAYLDTVDVPPESPVYRDDRRRLRRYDWSLRRPS